MWAGAHYRPIPGATEQLNSEAKLCAHTVRVMRRIARESAAAGVQMVQGVEHFEDPSADVLSLRTGQSFTGDDADGFRVLEPSGLPAKVRFGIEYETYCVNPHVYCSWLLGRFTALGGKTARRKLNTIEDAFKVPGEQGSPAATPIVINCSGRGFDQDPRTNIIRGQTVLVKNQYPRTVTRQHRDGKWTFLIPRPLGGGTIVGGTKEIGDWEAGPRPATRRELLSRAAGVFPDFVTNPDDFDVVQDNVGRRPWREGGARIEAETLSAGRTVIHGYGVGGRGYELSWGVAAEIMLLFKTLPMQRGKAVMRFGVRTRSR